MQKSIAPDGDRTLDHLFPSLLHTQLDQLSNFLIEILNILHRCGKTLKSIFTAFSQIKV